MLQNRKRGKKKGPRKKGRWRHYTLCTQGVRRTREENVKRQIYILNFVLHSIRCYSFLFLFCSFLLRFAWFINEKGIAWRTDSQFACANLYMCLWVLLVVPYLSCHSTHICAQANNGATYKRKSGRKAIRSNGRLSVRQGGRQTNC